MNDRELLEAAARAEGHGVEFDEVSGLVFMGNRFAGLLWNPLHNDGDALRLAVKLNLHVLRFQTMTMVKQITGEFSWDERDDGDPCAATRRAIVMAAAALQETSHG
jgi:hypothetical protein